MRALPVLALVSSLFVVAACTRGSHETPAPGASAEPEKPAAEKAPFRELSVDEVEKRLGDGKTFVYDANPREVFDKRHVPGAIWIPFDEVTADKLPKEKSATLIFYCANTH